MSVAAVRGRASARDFARSLAGRAQAALPLAGVFASLCALYAWLAWRQPTPWLFDDELLYAQLSRGVASTGHPLVHGAPYDYRSLYVYLIAPVWWIGDTTTAYELAKYVGAVVMTSVVFPTYALARLLVRPLPALFAAAAAGCIPAFVYSGMLMTETLSYPYVTLCLYLLTAALVRRSWRWGIPAAAASLFAPVVRGQLIVVPVAAALAVSIVLWISEPVRRRRAERPIAWWGGLAGSALAVAVVGNWVLTRTSAFWDTAIHHPGNIGKYAVWAFGALIIGLGVFPAVAAFATLVPVRGEATRERVAFASVLVSMVVCFAGYTGAKTAYLATTFYGERVHERNMTYVAPLLFVGAALWLQTRRARLLAVFGSVGVTIALLLGTQYTYSFLPLSKVVLEGARVHPSPLGDAPGFAILAQGHATFGWDVRFAETVVIALALLSGVVLVLPWLVRMRAATYAYALAPLAAGVVAWNVGGALAATSGTREYSKILRASLPADPAWVDHATGRARVLYLGQGVIDPNRVYLLEFWNRGIQDLWSLDGTAPGPGPTFVPRFTGSNGLLVDAPPARYVLADFGIDVAGKLVAQRGSFRLYRIGPRLRLRDAVTGIYGDAWTKSDATYTNFAASRRGGRVEVLLSRFAWGSVDVPARVTVAVGPVGVDGLGRAVIAKTTERRVWIAHSSKQKLFRIPAPHGPLRVEIHVAPLFIPVLLDRRFPDPRELGVQAGFRYVPARAHAH